MTATGLMLERSCAVAPQMVLLPYPHYTRAETVSVNRWASVYQVALVPVFQQLETFQQN